MRIAWTLLAAIALAAQPAAAEQAAPTEPTVIGVADNDAAMNRAIAEGQRTYPAFLRRLRQPGANENDFQVKFDIGTGDNVEFIWADTLVEADGRLTGRLNDAPVEPGLKYGQRVTIDPAKVIDWSYRDKGVTRGGFTNRVLLGMMPADQAAQLRKYFGW